jgi:Spy/CpxP family protein refolding chaperone
MKKLVISIVIVAAIAIVLGTASFVYAQTTTPSTPVPGAGFGRGMMNGQGYQGGMMGGQGPRGPMANSTAGAQVGFLHDKMIDAYAQKLGISVDELNTRLANGETMAQIASSKGLTADQFRTMMTDARSQAIDQAVKNGDLTQEQADWMKQRGAGMAAGGRGMRGAGLGWNVNPDCPYYSQTNP